MLELASACCFFLAFALFHAAAPGRFPLARTKPTRGLLSSMRLASVAIGGAGVASWSHTENTVAGLLVAAALLSLSGTLFVLIVPVFPRASWIIALACVPVVVTLLAAAGGHG